MDQQSNQGIRGRRPNQWERLAVAGAAAIAAVASLGGVGEALHIAGLWIAGVVVATIGFGLVAWFQLRAYRAEDLREKQEQLDAEQKRARRLLGLLATTHDDRDRVPRFDELTPYELGVDHERSTEETPYVERDQDGRLTDALAAAERDPQPRMVVLHGVSKAGKSRTLFEAVRADPNLRHASVLVPQNMDALAEFLQGDGPPALPDGQVILWLDDLERFVGPGERAMHRGALHEIAAWGRPTVVVSTAGGKGAEQFGEGGLSVPIDQLYSLPQVEVVQLMSDLSADEQARVRRSFPPDTATQMVVHGLGEYLVAAPELAHKLIRERHRSNDERCPEGAAVAWAAIDWARSGMAAAIPRPVLRELWPHYLHGIPPSDEHFEHGLEWALKPIYTSVALVSETSGYEAYDWIVSHAEREIGRSINDAAWGRIIDTVDPAAALQVGATAYAKGFVEGSRRAFVRAAEARDPLVVARSAFNLGVVLEQQGDAVGAEASYRQAADSEQGEPATKAAAQLGRLAEQRDQLEEAEVSYRRAIALGHPPHAAMTALRLGLMLARQGKVRQAADAFEQAIALGDTVLKGRAAVILGDMLENSQLPAEARRAYERAIEFDDRSMSAAAAMVALGDLLACEGDLPAARQAYGHATRASHPGPAATAQERLRALDGAVQQPLPHEAPVPPAAGDGVRAAAQEAGQRAHRLEQAGDFAGARAAYEQAVASGVEDLAPAAALGLAMLLQRSGDPEGARNAYQQAIAFGHKRFSPAAAYRLGQLLVEECDIPAAREALSQALQSDIPSVASASRSLLESLS